MDGVQVNTVPSPSVDININDGEDVNVYDGLDDQGFSCNIHTGCLGGGRWSPVLPSMLMTTRLDQIGRHVAIFSFM